jgi:phosphonate transport system substrate-binding protein
MTPAFIFPRPFTFLLITVLLFFNSVGSPVYGNEKNQQLQSERETIHLGIITLYHPLVMYRKYQPFADYLSENTPYSFTLKISENYSQIIDYLSKGTVSAAILGGMTYLEAKKKVDIIPLLSALGEDGKPFCQGVFITRNDNKRINKLEDIKNTRFAFASIHSTSGNLMPLHYLYSKKGIQLSDFKSYDNLKYHDSVIRNVLRGNYDAGVALGTIASQYKDVGLKFIDRTDPFPGFLLVVRKDMPAHIINSINSALLALDYNDEQYRKAMDTWDVNIRYGFYPTSDEAYETIHEAVSSLSKYGIEWR